MRGPFRTWRCAAVMCALLAVSVAPATGQTGSANNGAMTFAGSLDASNAYLFRGIPQDDTGLILWPALDMGVTLRSVTLNVGTWNSLHTGVTGRDGPTQKLWYESDFYAGASVGLGKGVAVAAIYTAYTSPNNAFASVEELAFKLSGRVYHTTAYALVAFELKGQADGGVQKGRYLELGATPAYGVGGLQVSVPVRVGLSLDGYYEGILEDERFGFFSVGGNVSVPIANSARFGRWNVHGGADYVRLGESNADRLGENNKVIISAGIGFSY